jgi:hypothetical protein
MTEDVIKSIEPHQRQISPPASVSEQHPNMDKDGSAKSLIDDLQSKMTLMEKENKKELELLQQEKAQRDKENRQLREKLARMEVGLHDDANNDINYDSEDGSGGENDINYDSESYASDDDSDKSSVDLNYDSDDNPNNTINHSDDNFADSNFDSDDNAADPNYNSSDNEDN